MPRPPRPWFRFYVEAVNDRKLRRRDPAQRWLWVCILAAARQSCISGFLMVSIREPMDDDDLADFAGVPVKLVRTTLPLFEQSGMIHRDDDLAAWQVTNWADRQYESDDVTARTRKHRRRNDDGTSLERSNSVPGNVPQCDVGTPPETETETEKTLVPHLPSTSSSRVPVESIQEAMNGWAERRRFA